MSLFDGMTGWAFYGLSAALTFLAWHRLSAGFESLVLRDVTRVTALAVLATPAPVPGYEGHYAPAWLITLFEAVLRREGDPLPAASMLLLVLVVLLGAVALWRYLRSDGRSGGRRLPHRG